MPILGTVDTRGPSRNPHETDAHPSSANPCKWDSQIRRPPEAGAEPRPPESRAPHRERGGRVDARGQGERAVRPPGRDPHSPRVPARTPGVGVGGAPLGPGGLERGNAARQPDQAGNGERPPLARAGTAGLAEAGAGRADRRGVRVRERARRTADGGRVSEALGAGGGGIRRGLSGPSPHAPARLRLQAGERRPRYSRHPTLPGAQEHPAYRALYGIIE